MRYPRASERERTAPAGKFRLIALDLTDNSDAEYCLGDFDSLESAKQVAEEKSSVGQPIFVYDDKGELVVRHGSWH